jgi:hypothetical protein
MEVEELYSQITSLWERFHADVLSHVCLIGFILIAGFSIPTYVLALDPGALLKHPWFHLAKEFGIPLVASLGVTLTAWLYYSFLRLAGSIVATPVLPLLFNTDKSPDVEALRKNRYALAVIASTLPKDKRRLSDIQHRYSALLRRYSTLHNDKFVGLRQGLNAISRSSYAYFRNFFLFSFLWLIAMVVFGGIPQQLGFGDGNRIYLTLLLFIFVAIAAVRLKAFTFLAQEKLVNTVTQIILEDNEFDWQNLPEKERLLVYSVVDKIIEEIDAVWSSPPSLLGYVAYKAGKGSKAKRLTNRDFTTRHSVHYALVHRGMDFLHSGMSRTYDDKKWTRDYLAYRYFRLTQKLSHH